jgi:hypothetical protein
MPGGMCLPPQHSLAWSALPVCSIFIASQVIGKFSPASMIMLICGCWHVFLSARPPVQLG